MQLVGLSFARGPEPLQSGWLGLGDLSVVVGANDSGKSTLLGLVNRYLEFADADDPAADSSMLSRGVHAGVTTFIRAEPDEAELLFFLATADLRWTGAGKPQRRGISDSAFWEREPTTESRRFSAAELPWDGESLDEGQVQAGASAQLSYLELLRSNAPGVDSEWKLVLDRLAGSGIFAVRWGDHVTLAEDQVIQHHGWELFWALDSPRNDAELASALAACSLTDDQTVTGEPVVVAPIGPLPRGQLPRIVAAPASFESIRSDLEHELTGALIRLGNAPPNLEHPGPDEAWYETQLDVSPELARYWVHPEALLICDAAAEAANAALPGFLRARYELVFRLRPLPEWTDHRIELELRDTASNAKFPISSIADGYAVWVQIAVLEASDAVRRFAARLGLHQLRAMDEQVDVEDIDPTLPPPPGEQGVRWLLWGDLAAFRAGHLSGDVYGEFSVSDYPDSQREVLPGIVRQSFVDLLAAARPRVYLIDEPERHLHPRLQRQAASWLASLVSERSSQALIATHSVAFMSTEAHFSYVSRPAGSASVVRPMLRDDLDAATEIGMDLGLDRGELMALYETFLFVEGSDDEALLTSLYGAELREAGVCVVALRGAQRGSGVLEAAVLARVTAAHLAVWLDSTREEVVDQIALERKFALKVKQDKKAFSAEERTLAELALEAHEQNRSLHIIANPQDDVFFHLDDSVLQSMCPEYPGHDLARAAYREEQRKPITWRDHCIAAYALDVKDPALYRDVGRRMRAEGITPPDLQKVIDDCKALLAGAL